MFSGIIQSFGYLDKINKDKNIYIIKTDLNLSNINIGSSICCDGVCLTVIDIFEDKNNDNTFSVNISEETLIKSNIINWKISSKINLEKSLRVGDEISGHFVYGHVDTTTKILNISNLQNSWEFEFQLPLSYFNPIIKSLIVEKGSVAINGISLTISKVTDNSFTVSIIPHTYINTNLSFLNLNDIVNIEFDPLARYIQKKYDK